MPLQLFNLNTNFMRSSRFQSLWTLITLLSLSEPLAAQRTILWKVSKPGNAHVSYLLGTFHTLGESFIDSFPVIKDRLLSSDLYVSEALADPQAIIHDINARPESDTLRIMVSAQQLEQIKEIYHKSSLDIFKLTPAELTEQLVVFYFQYGCHPASLADKYTSDEYLQQIVHQYNKPAFYFETDSMQEKLLRDQTTMMDWKYFKKRVGYLLQMYKMKPTAAVCKPEWSYLAFDIDYDFDKACKDKVVVENRNDAWMNQLPALLDQHNCFVDVGMQHLRNRCGLIVQLKAQGYLVEPMPM